MEGTFILPFRLQVTFESEGAKWRYLYPKLSQSMHSYFLSLARELIWVTKKECMNMKEVDEELAKGLEELV